MARKRGPLLRAKFHPHRCNVSPLRGEKPQNRHLSKLNTGRFALRAMLLVKIVGGRGGIVPQCPIAGSRLSYRFDVFVRFHLCKRGFTDQSQSDYIDAYDAVLRL